MQAMGRVQSLTQGAASQVPLLGSTIEMSFIQKSHRDEPLAQPNQGESNILFITGSVYLSFLSVAIPYIVALVIDGVLGLMEYTSIMTFAQFPGTYALAIYKPFVQSLFHAVGFALATSVSNVVTRGLLKGHVNAAQSAFRIFMFSVLGWAAIAGIIVAPLSQRISLALDGQFQSFPAANYLYLLMMSVFGMIGSLFSSFTLPIMAADGRTLLNATKHVFGASFSMVFQTASYFYIQAYNDYQEKLYNNHEIDTPKRIPPLLGSVVGSIISQFVITTWILFMLTDVTFLGIPHTGALRLCGGKGAKAVKPKGSKKQIRERKNIAIQNVQSIAKFFTQNYLTQSYAPGLILFINSFTNAVYDRENYMHNFQNRVTNLVFLQSYALFSAAHLAISLTFRTLGLHTLRNRLYTRTRILYLVCLLHSIFLPIVLCGIGIFSGDYVVSKLTPTMYKFWGKDANIETVEILPSLQKAFKRGATFPILLGPYYLIITIHEIEDKWLQPLLFSLGRCIISNVAVLCFGLTTGDSVDFLPSIFYGDIFASLIGIGYAVTYGNKYMHLSAVEQLRAQMNSIDQQLNNYVEKEQTERKHEGENSSDTSEKFSSSDNPVSSALGTHTQHSGAISTNSNAGWDKDQSEF